MKDFRNIKSIIKWLLDEGAYEVKVGENVIEAKFEKSEKPTKAEPVQETLIDRAKKLKEIYTYQSKEIETEKSKQDDEEMLYWSS